MVALSVYRVLQRTVVLEYSEQIKLDFKISPGYFIYNYL